MNNLAFNITTDQTTISRYQAKVDGIVNDYEVLGKLTSGYKLMVYKDGQNAAHLDISWWHSGSTIGQCLQSVGRTCGHYYYGPNDHDSVFKHIQDVNKSVCEYIRLLSKLQSRASACARASARPFPINFFVEPF